MKISFKIMGILLFPVISQAATITGLSPQANVNLDSIVSFPATINLDANEKINSIVGSGISFTDDCGRVLQATPKSCAITLTPIGADEGASIEAKIAVNTTKGRAQQSIQLSYQYGEAIDGVQILPQEIDIGDVSFPGGIKVSEMINVKNSGTLNSGSLTVNLIGTGFKIRSNLCNGKNLAPKASCKIQLQYHSMNVIPGEKLGELQILVGPTSIASAVVKSNLINPFYVESVVGLPELQISMLESSVNVSPGSTRAVIASIKNIGGAPTLLAPLPALSGQGWSIRSNSCLAALQPNGTCQVSLLFNTQGLTVGSHPAELTVDNKQSGVVAIIEQPATDFPLVVYRLGDWSGVGLAINGAGSGGFNFEGGTRANFIALNGATVTYSIYAGLNDKSYSWGGACAGTVGTSCSFIMNAAKTISLTFSDPVNFLLTLSPTSNGTISGSPAGQKPENTVINLTATPTEGFEFSSWTGDCAGQLTNQCSITMNSAKTVGALFAEIENPEPISEYTLAKIDLIDRLSFAPQAVPAIGQTVDPGPGPSISSAPLPAYITDIGAEIAYTPGSVILAAKPAIDINVDNVNISAVSDSPISSCTLLGTSLTVPCSVSNTIEYSLNFLKSAISLSDDSLSLNINGQLAHIVPVVRYEISQVSDTRVNNNDAPTYLTSFNNELFFVGSTAAGRNKLMKIGTEGLVTQAFNFRGDGFSDNPRNLKTLNGELYFDSANGTGSVRLFKLSSTGILSPVFNGSRPSGNNNFPILHNNELFFAVEKLSGIYYDKLYKKSQSGDITQLTDIRSLSNCGELPAGGAGYEIAGDYIGAMTIFNNEVYFSAHTCENNFKIHKIALDGSVKKVSNILVSQQSISPVVFAGAMYFISNNSIIHKLSSNGEITRISGQGGSNSMIVFNNELYFTADGHLSRMNSSGIATQVSGMYYSESIHNLTIYKDELYFFANNSLGLSKLHKIDKQGQITQMSDINPGASDSATATTTRIMEVNNGSLYFVARVGTYTKLFKLEKKD